MSLLSVMLQSGMPLEQVRANIKLTISGGQNEPRDAIAARYMPYSPTRSACARAQWGGHMDRCI